MNGIYLGDLFYQIVAFLVLVLIISFFGKRLFANNVYSRLRRIEEKLDKLHEEMKQGNNNGK
jgi:F0F1-type ATP synthase membrane subunit b/b'